MGYVLDALLLATVLAIGVVAYWTPFPERVRWLRIAIPVVVVLLVAFSLASNFLPPMTAK